MTERTHAYHTPPGVEVILASVLTCAMGVDNYLPCGITVLTEAVLDRIASRRQVAPEQLTKARCCRVRLQRTNLPVSEGIARRTCVIRAYFHAADPSRTPTRLADRLAA